MYICGDKDYLVHKIWYLCLKTVVRVAIHRYNDHNVNIQLIISQVQFGFHQMSKRVRSYSFHNFPFQTQLSPPPWMCKICEIRPLVTKIEFHETTTLGIINLFSLKKKTACRTIWLTMHNLSSQARNYYWASFFDKWFLNLLL